MKLNNFCETFDASKGLSPPQLQIEMADVETIGDFWSFSALPGIHWRLYYNNAPGAGLILPDRRKVEMTPDRLYLIAPYTKLGTYCHGEPEHLFIHFILTCHCGTASEPVHAVPADAVMRNLIEQLRPMLKKRPQDSMSQLLCTALAALALTHLPPGTLRFAQSDPRISDACTLMRNDPGHQWSNAELAARYGFAVNSFTRKFREVMGVTPYHYLNTLRYALAAHLLESTTLTLGEICSRIGINDQSHFSREFKRFHERSPSLYRRVRTAMKEN